MSGAFSTPARRVRLRLPISPPSPATLLALALALAFVGLMIYPLGWMLGSLFVSHGQLDASAIGETFRLPGIGDTLLNTLYVVLAGGTLAMVIGSLFAWLNERTDARMGWASDILPVLPLVVPGLAVVIGWVLLLAPGAGLLNAGLRALLGSDATRGPMNIYTWPGLIALYAVELVPFVYLTVSAGLRQIDPELEEASRMSGSDLLRTLRRVTLPAVKPSLAAAGLLVLVIGCTLFSAAAIVGTPARIDILSARIVRMLTASFPPQTDQAVVLSACLLIVVVVGWLAQSRILRSKRYFTIQGRGARATRTRLGPWRWVARGAMLLYILATTVLPALSLALISLESYWTARPDFAQLTLAAYRSLFEGEQTRRALLDSAGLGIASATATMVIAFTIAMLAHHRAGALSALLDGLAKVPAALSHMVIAVALVVAFAGPPLSLGGTLTLLLLGYVVIYLPPASVAAGSAVTQVGAELTEASRMSGAGWLRTLRRVQLPLMLPGLAVGWTIGFVFVQGDLTASVLLASTNTPTNGMMILQLYENTGYPLVAALALLVTVVSATMVSVVLRLTHGRLPR